MLKLKIDLYLLFISFLLFCCSGENTTEFRDVSEFPNYVEVTGEENFFKNIDDTLSLLASTWSYSLTSTTQTGGTFKGVSGTRILFQMNQDLSWGYGLEFGIFLSNKFLDEGLYSINDYRDVAEEDLARLYALGSLGENTNTAYFRSSDQELNSLGEVKSRFFYAESGFIEIEELGKGIFLGQFSMTLGFVNDNSKLESEKRDGVIKVKGRFITGGLNE